MHPGSPSPLQRTTPNLCVRCRAGLRPGDRTCPVCGGSVIQGLLAARLAHRPGARCVVDPRGRPEGPLLALLRDLLVAWTTPGRRAPRTWQNAIGRRAIACS